jgi:methionyl-tRNA formyltransferase
MNIVFMGTPEFAIPSLTKLYSHGYPIRGVITQPDRPKGRKKILQPPPIKQVALQFGLDVFQPQSMKEPSAIQKLKEWSPDVIVTAAFGQILPREILTLPPYGAINVHASLLPKYRGGAPVQRAIMNGEQETGVTIMYMAEKLDSGDILSQVVLPIGEQDDAGSMLDKLSKAGADLLLETLENMAKGCLKPRPQNDEEATYAPLIRREDEQIDWKRPAREIFNQIRALSPHPGAFTMYGEQMIKIWRGKQTEQNHLPEPPGTIYQLDQDGIGVVCGDKKGLLITEIQPAGKKRMSSADFLRGVGQTWKIGQQLG